MQIIQEKKEYDLFCKIKAYSHSKTHPFHWHENYEICQVINKPSAFRIDGELVEALPGDIITISEQTVHQFIIKEENTNIRVIQFNSNILFGVTDKILPLKTHIPCSEIEKDKVLKNNLESLLNLLEHEENTDSSDKNNYYKAITAALYFFLQQHFPSIEKTRSGKRNKNDFYKIVEYINEHYTKDITVNSISAHFYFSRGKLSSVFKKYAGVGINEYINQLRIKNANKLLLQGESITCAALSSGFESIRTFNNCYKKIMGITPGEYVKSR